MASRDRLGGSWRKSGRLVSGVHKGDGQSILAAWASGEPFQMAYPSQLIPFPAGSPLRVDHLASSHCIGSAADCMSQPRFGLRRHCGCSTAVLCRYVGLRTRLQTLTMHRLHSVRVSDYHTKANSCSFVNALIFFDQAGQYARWVSTFPVSS